MCWNIRLKILLDLDLQLNSVLLHQLCEFALAAVTERPHERRPVACTDGRRDGLLVQKLMRG
jgi:hypothetical protein